MSGRPLYSIMQGVPVKDGTKPRLVARSTASYIAPNGDAIIRFHRTDIIRRTGNAIILNSGGRKTVTAKKRMNGILWGLNLWSKRGKWIIGIPYHPNDPQFAFYDGIILNSITLRPLYEKPIPPKPPKPPRLTPSDASKWLRILTQEPPQ